MASADGLAVSFTLTFGAGGQDMAMSIGSMFAGEGDKDLLLAKLKELGVDYVQVSFDGSGDSGEINDVEFHSNKPEPETPYTAINVGGAILAERVTERSVPSKDGGWTRKVSVEGRTLKDVVMDMTYAALDRTGLDWYNNDGGYGSLTLTVNEEGHEDGELSANLDVSIRITETEDHSFTLTDDPDAEE
jgi:hypothetical protein